MECFIPIENVHKESRKGGGEEEEAEEQEKNCTYPIKWNDLPSISIQAELETYE